jgi:hypothetical protein
MLGSAIMVSVNNGFPTAAKWIQVANNYLFARPTACKLEFMNAIVPQDIVDYHRLHGFFFLWCKDTEKL